MATTPGYVDSCFILNNAYQLDLSPWVNNHNLFSLMAFALMKIFSFADEFVVANSLSMVCGAGTVFFINLVCFNITQNRLAAGIASLSVMISHSLFWHSTMLEVYTLNSLIMMAMVYCFYRYFSGHKIKYAYIGIFLWGLGISNHVLMGLFLPAILYFIIIRIRTFKPINFVIGLGCFLLGLSPFLSIFIMEWIANGSVVEILTQNTGGDFTSLMFSGNRFWFWKFTYSFFFVYQFSLPILIVGFFGFKFLFRKNPFFVFFLIAFFTQLLWSSNYHIWDCFAFAIPVYVMFSVPIACGINHIIKKPLCVVFVSSVIVFSVAQLALYANIDKIQIMKDYISGYPMVEMVEKQFDPIKYFFNPFKRDFTRVDDYITQFKKKIPPNARVYDNIYDYPFLYYYQRIKKERLDIYSPIIFYFWVKEPEISYWAKEINYHVFLRNEVFVSEFVFSSLKHKLRNYVYERFQITEDSSLLRLKRK